MITTAPAPLNKPSAPIADNFTRAARLLRIVDGDTVDLEIDQGNNTFQRVTVRVLGINCPEVHGPTKPAGLAATAASAHWFATHERLFVTTRKPADFDAFRRYLAQIVGTNADGLQESLGDYLLSNGHAVPFAG